VTAQKHLKQFIRARMAKTGESYAAARRQVISQAPPTAEDTATRCHRPGDVPAAVALRVLLAHQGVELTEAMLFGIAGGIGAGVFAFLYEKEDFASFFIAGRHQWQDDKAYLDAACNRLGVTAIVRESPTARGAEKQLRELLNQAGPVIAWIDMGSLPHRAMPPVFSGSGYHVVTIYELSDTSALVGDLTDEPVEIPLAQLAEARGRIKKFKNRLLALGPARPALDLPNLVRSGVRVCHHLLTTCKMKNFTLEAFRIWAERIYGGKAKDSWERVFPPGHRLWRGLTSVYDFIEHYGTGGGLCRPMFGKFLTEAALVTSDQRFADLGKRYAQLGKAWTSLAEAALPAHIPMFKKARELFTRRNELMFRGDSVDKLRATWEELESLQVQARERFPLDVGQCAELRRGLKERILGLYQSEEEALRALGELVT